MSCGTTTPNSEHLTVILLCSAVPCLMMTECAHVRQIPGMSNLMFVSASSAIPCPFAMRASVLPFSQDSSFCLMSSGITVSFSTCAGTAHSPQSASGLLDSEDALDTDHACDQSVALCAGEAPV